jgi:TonB family protein
VATAGQMLLTPRLRPRTGPALRTVPLPVTAAVFSAVAHLTLVALLVLSATLWSKSQSKVYVVNLVPAVAAVGTPQGRATTPTPTPRPPEPPRAAERPPALPERPTPRPPAPAPEPPTRTPELPARAPELPARAPQLPARTEPPARTTAALPERPSLPRPASTPRPGEKELPPLASAATPPAPAPPAPSAAARPEPPPPPAALGRPSGSGQGSGAVTLNVSDFPFAWYLAAVQRKITERWEGRALQGRQPVVVFEIARDGQVSNVAVKNSSGNQYYDLIATRAIAEAAPFPRLPDEFPGSVLRIHLGFNFAQDRG